jgi:folate-binding protein YgfZ
MNKSSMGSLKISGTGAKKFLQGQLTCDLESVGLNPQLAAHCNPQGRIISLFHIRYDNDAYYLNMPTSLLEIAKSALQKYAVFFKVSIEVTDDNLTAQATTDTAYIYPETSSMFLPHELNLDELGAISFNKGCYTGQEIIARMHYRGQLKNRLHRATLATNQAPVRGTDLHCLHENSIQIGGKLVDYQIDANNRFHLHIICSDEHAINHHLFFENDKNNYLTFNDEAAE